MNRTLNLTCLIIILIINSMWAQETTGRIEGRILNTNGESIPLASVSMNSTSMQGIRNTVTNEKGYFYALGIPVGNYTINISHMSKQSVIFENIIVMLGKTTSLGDIILNEKVNEIGEVVIHSDKPIVDVNSTSSGLNLEQEVYETLPVQRDYKSVVSLSPHATESYYGDGLNLSGGTGWENTYYIDGTNVTDPRRGATGTNLPYNFVKEIQVKNGGYEAEFGKALGGIINVITHQGGNQFHGQVFGFFTDQSFAGDFRQGAVRKRIKDFATYDFGISFGGPLLHDKLWYFIAYNPNFQDQDVEIPGHGIYKDRTRSHLFAGKLTWQLTSKTNMVLTILGDPTKQERVESQYSGTMPNFRSAEKSRSVSWRYKNGGIQFIS